MGITSAIVLFAVIWFLVLFVVLPLRLKTQGDVGEVVPGTHASAPADFQPKRVVRTVTIVAVILWAIIAGTILSGVITVRDIDFMNRMGDAPKAAAQE